MTADAAGRPQDVGRTRRRKGSPSPETASLLTRYHDAMRAELRALLDDVAPKEADPGLGLVPEKPKRLSVKDRGEAWKLAILLGRELGSAIEPTPPPSDAVTPTRRRGGKVDFGGA